MALRLRTSIYSFIHGYQIAPAAFDYKGNTRTRPRFLRINKHLRVCVDEILLGQQPVLAVHFYYSQPHPIDPCRGFTRCCWVSPNSTTWCSKPATVLESYSLGRLRVKNRAVPGYRCIPDGELKEAGEITHDQDACTGAPKRSGTLRGSYQHP